MANEQAKIDENRRKTLLGVTDDANAETRRVLIDPTTGRLKVSAVIGGGVVFDTLFDANTIIKADVDNTPEALTVAEQTLVGRITGGEITALTSTQVRTLLNVADGATNYTDENVDDRVSSLIQNGTGITWSYNDVAGTLTPTVSVTAHKASHENGGSDEISVAGLSGLLADAQTPTTHATSHVTGGTDVIANAVASGNAGLMSGTDKAKLDGIEAGATNDTEITSASASSATSFDFFEDTDNGTNKIRVIAPSAVASDKTLTLPDSTGTIATQGYSDALFLYGLRGPNGFLVNGKIVPSVSSGNLTVAIKGIDGNDPSASNPVYIKIGDVVRSITSALSVTKNSGSNWLNLGSSELAGREVDLFPYLTWDSVNSQIDIAISRYPGAAIQDDFTWSETSEKGLFGNSLVATSGDKYELIGRFAATLSAGAGYTWSVPTFTNKNLVQRPIYETRWLTWLPTTSASGSMTATLTAHSAYYKIRNNSMDISFRVTCTTGGTASTNIQMTTPFASISTQFDANVSLARVVDSTSLCGYVTDTGVASKIGFGIFDNRNWQIGTDKYAIGQGTIIIG